MSSKYDRHTSNIKKQITKEKCAKSQKPLSSTNSRSMKESTSNKRNTQFIPLSLQTEKTLGPQPAVTKALTVNRTDTQKVMKTATDETQSPMNANTMHVNMDEVQSTSIRKQIQMKNKEDVFTINAAQKSDVTSDMQDIRLNQLTLSKVTEQSLDSIITLGNRGLMNPLEKSRNHQATLPNTKHQEAIEKKLKNKFDTLSNLPISPNCHRLPVDKEDIALTQAISVQGRSPAPSQVSIPQHVTTSRSQLLQNQSNTNNNGYVTYLLEQLDKKLNRVEITPKMMLDFISFNYNPSTLASRRIQHDSQDRIMSDESMSGYEMLVEKMINDDCIYLNSGNE